MKWTRRQATVSKFDLREYPFSGALLKSPLPQNPLLSNKAKLNVVNDTHRGDWCFTQFSTGMAGWLLLIFLICLHNQLSSIHSIISTDVWKMWFIILTVKMDGCSFQQVYGKIWVSFCLNTGKRFFLEVLFSSQQKEHMFF